MKASRVLIIDDEISLLNSLIAFFEDEGFDASGAASGEEALDMLTHSEMDAVIVDMRLPGMDGNEVILRAHQLLPRLRFIIHTGSTDYQLPAALRVLVDPADIYLKPLTDLTILTEAVRRLCGNPADSPGRD
jgi:DNA-binding NtrC family response regulator